MKNKYFFNSVDFPFGFSLPHTISGMSPQTPILVGFSGGADSRTLLHLLSKYQKAANTTVYACHVNHGIRGKEADRDEMFCRRIAEEYQIEFFSIKLNIPEIAKKTKKSIELAARDERYAYFSSIMKEHNIPLLAVAHNADDNLETILLNLTRGSGISGLCGIPPVRECENGRVIRPILNMSRSEILEYCKENELCYVSDSTNTDTEYSRNRIRARVIPELRKINPSVEKNALQMSSLLRRDAVCLDNLAKEHIESELSPDGSVSLDFINSKYSAIASRIIMKLYERISNTKLEQVHINDVLLLCHRKIAHSSLSMPNGISAVIKDNRLIISKDLPKKITKEEFFVEAHAGNNPISQINSEIIIGNTHKRINIYKKSIQFYIDSAKINGALVLRSRTDGDKIQMGGMHKSIKKLMCDNKIPIDERYRIPILCDDSGVVAVPFLGVRDGYRANELSPNALSLKFYLY